MLAKSGVWRHQNILTARTHTIIITGEPNSTIETLANEFKAAKTVHLITAMIQTGPCQYF